jgi:hypothetical protein
MHEVNATPSVPAANPTTSSATRPTVSSQVGPWAMVPVWILGLGLTGGEIGIYVSLRSYCDRNGDCYPTAKAVAVRAGCSVGSVRNAIQRFRRLGILTTTEVYRAGTRELSHLRYHLIDLDPRHWSVEPREVSTDDGTGLHQPSDTCTPTGVDPYTNQLTQEHTNEHPTDHSNETPPPRASSSSAKHSPRSRRPEEDEAARRGKIEKRKSQERQAAVEAIVARLATDAELAEATIDYLYELKAEAGETIRSVRKYVDGIPDAELSEHHDAAGWTVRVRRENVKFVVDQVVERSPRLSKAKRRAFADALNAAFLGGHSMKHVIDALNGAHREGSRDVIADYLGGLAALEKQPVAA